MQSHLIPVLAWPIVIMATILVLHRDGHLMHMLQHNVQCSTVQPSPVQSGPVRVRSTVHEPNAPCQPRRPRLFGATLAFASQIQIDRCRPSTTHGQALPLPTFTSQGFGSENKSTGAKKQFLTSQLPKPRWVLLAATRPAADESSMTLVSSTRPGTSLPCAQFSARTGCPPAVCSLGFLAV